jgi:hypothetical protein
VIVSNRALYARIDRALRRDGEQLRTARSEAMESQAGRYYIVDTERNFISHMDVELEELGRELGVLEAWEELRLGE